jgi:hypothetical protein
MQPFSVIVPLIPAHDKNFRKLLKYLNDNDLEWVTQVMKEKQEKVEGKPTHYLEVDEWKPVQVANKPVQKSIIETDTLPF